MLRCFKRDTPVLTPAHPPIMPRPGNLHSPFPFALWSTPPSVFPSRIFIYFENYIKFTVRRYLGKIPDGGDVKKAVKAS